MPNIGGSREAKRRLVASVVHWKLLYAAPVWANALQNHSIHMKLFSAQRFVALRIVSAGGTVSTGAMLVLASVPPIDLLAKERQEIFQLRKELTCTGLQEIARGKEAIRKDGRHRLVEKCQMRWHGEQTGRWTYIVQATGNLLGHYLLQKTGCTIRRKVGHRVIVSRFGQRNMIYTFFINI